jgi:hypothetical protein
LDIVSTIGESTTFSFSIDKIEAGHDISWDASTATISQLSSQFPTCLSDRMIVEEIRSHLLSVVHAVPNLEIQIKILLRFASFAGTDEGNDSLKVLLSVVHLCRKLISSRIGMACLFLIGIGFFPEMAAASCGDYLRYGSSHRGMDDDKHSAHKEYPNAPCRGPECSRQQSQSKLPAPPAAPQPTVDEWVSGIIGLPFFHFHACRRQRTEDDGFPVRRPSSIFHPPRV